MRFFTIFLVAITWSSVTQAQSICHQLAGAFIVAQDGKYLGKISSQFDTDSVLNEFGKHGSEFSSESIWNEFGPYGGQFSSNSPFNEFSSKPPLIIKNGQRLGYLSVVNASNALNPYVLKSCKDAIY